MKLRSRAVFLEGVHEETTDNTKYLNNLDQYRPQYEHPVWQGYDPDAQYGNHVDLLDFHYLSCPLWEEQLNAGNPVDVKFKIRHTPDFAHGRLECVPDPVYGKVYRITSDTRIQGIAAGQYGVIYSAVSDGSVPRLVVASGMII